MVDWMTEYPGISLWDAGIVAGIILNIDSKKTDVGKKSLPVFASEEEAFFYAKEEVIDRLVLLHDHTLRLAGEENASIFAAQKMILEDEDFCREVLQLIEEKKTATEAICEVARKWEHVLERNGADSIFGERASDISALAAELVAVLSEENVSNQPQMLDEPVILVTDHLSPSTLMGIPREKILAIVMRSQAIHSHVAILAKSMRIPTLMGCEIDLSLVKNGERGIVDLTSAVFVQKPFESAYQAAIKCAGQNVTRGKKKRREAFLKSGITIYANINTPEELSGGIVETFEGIGLLRTEFLYMNRDKYPSEEEQYISYKHIAQRMQGKPLVIRTIDLGDDKVADYLCLPEEKNPSLGYRGIRFCLDRQDVFMTQLRAIMRAAAYGEIKILLPMITTLNEVEQAKQIVETIANELEEKKIPFNIPPVGIMIETPAAVLISEELAEYADFFSIGTNDLAQYTLAADRQSGVDYMNQVYNPNHPAVLKLIEMTVDNAHKKGIKAGICGEMGADLSLIGWFGEIGVDSLSIAPVLFME